MGRGLLVVAATCCLSSLVGTDAACKSIVDCENFRVHIPILTDGERTVCAASFKFGQYGDINSVSDLPRSSSLSKQFEGLPEAKRWEYPEYAMVKYFEAWTSCDQRAAAACTVRQIRPRFKGLSPEMKQRWGCFENAYAYRTYFGPYVEVADLLVKFSGVAPNEEANVLFGGSQVLRKVGGRYLLAFGWEELTTSHIFREVTFNIYSLARKNNYMLRLQDIPQVSKAELDRMKWFAMDTKFVADGEKKTLSAYSNREGTIPASFSDNYLRICMDLVPVNIQLRAGQRASDLSGEIRFFESAVTATHVGGTESDILALWCEDDRDRIERRIKRLKESKGDRWSEHYLSHIGSSPTVLAQLRNSNRTLVYYKGKMQPDVDVVGVKATGDGYSLFRLPDNIFRADEFKEAVRVLYGQ